MMYSTTSSRPATVLGWSLLVAALALLTVPDIATKSSMRRWAALWAVFWAVPIGIDKLLVWKERCRRVASSTKSSGERQ